MGTVSKQWIAAGGDSGDWEIKKLRNKQAKPIDYRMPLEYFLYRKKLIAGLKGTVSNPVPYYRWMDVSTWQDTLWSSSARNDENCSDTGFQSDLPSGSEWNMAYSRAYSKFLEASYQRADMMTNFAERGQSVQMLTSRLSQILKGARQLKAGKFRGFLETFGIKPLKKHAGLKWTRPRQFAGLWLEYWFGWAPVINDIYTATTNYGTPIKDQIVKQGSAREWSYSRTRYHPSQWAGESIWMHEEGSVRVTICGKIVVENSSLFELNKAGLVNPAVTALELIPFSWLAGWFNNLAQVLRQYTDFVGLRLVDATVSTKTKRMYTHEHTLQGSINKWTGNWQVYGRRKIKTLPRIKLYASLPNGLSVTRGATLASIVVQLFSPKGK